MHQLTHLVAWTKVKKGIAFFISSGTIQVFFLLFLLLTFQVNFVDHSKIIVTPIPNPHNLHECYSIDIVYVTHAGRKRFFTVFPIENITELPQDAAKRLLFLTQQIPKLLKNIK